jgi:hypothetical protein
MHEPGIIRHHVIKIPGALQRPDYGIVSAFEDSNYATFATSLYSSGRGFWRYTRHNAISMHRCADIFSRDKNILLARFF